jgi:hypothetical protein
MSEQQGKRPMVVGVPLETAKASPHWVPPSQQPAGAAQPVLGSSRPLFSAGRAVPIMSGSGRIPDGNGNGSMKQKSVFEGPRGAGAQINQVRLMGGGPQLQQLQVSQAAHGGAPPPPQDFGSPEVRRGIGQATPVETPVREAQIERIIERQLPPQGMTKKEAQLLADSLAVAVVVAQEALAAGEKCFGVDDAVIGDVKATRDYLASFAYSANEADRTNPARLPKEKLDNVERVIECQMAHERLMAQGGPSILALLIGGAIVAGVTYVLVKNL